MSDIVIVGGHGRVALLTAPLLVEAGNTVTSVIRDPDQSAEVSATGVEARVADIEALSTDDICTLLDGHDTVIWAAGAGGGDPERTAAVDRDAAIRTVNAAEEVGAHRFIMVSWCGSYDDHGIPDSDPFHHYADAKAEADDHLREADLDWTVLGPSTLTDAPGNGCISLIGEDDGRTAGTSVPRETVAEVIATAVNCPQCVGHTVRFNAGNVPADEALRHLDINWDTALDGSGTGYE